MLMIPEDQIPFVIIYGILYCIQISAMIYTIYIYCSNKINKKITLHKLIMKNIGSLNFKIPAKEDCNETSYFDIEFTKDISQDDIKNMTFIVLAKA